MECRCTEHSTNEEFFKIKWTVRYELLLGSSDPIDSILYSKVDISLGVNNHTMYQPRKYHRTVPHSYEARARLSWVITYRAWVVKNVFFEQNRHCTIVVGRRAFVIVEGWLNLYTVVHMHRVYTWYKRYVYSEYSAARRRPKKPKISPVTNYKLHHCLYKNNRKVGCFVKERNIEVSAWLYPCPAAARTTSTTEPQACKYWNESATSFVAWMSSWLLTSSMYPFKVPKINGCKCDACSFSFELHPLPWPLISMQIVRTNHGDKVCFPTINEGCLDSSESLLADV